MLDAWVNQLAVMRPLSMRRYFVPSARADGLVEKFAGQVAVLRVRQRGLAGKCRADPPRSDAQRGPGQRNGEAPRKRKNRVLMVVKLLADAPETRLAVELAATLAVTLPNSRAGESEADRMGIELAACGRRSRRRRRRRRRPSLVLSKC